MRKLTILIATCFYLLSCNVKPDVNPDGSQFLRISPNPVNERVTILVINQTSQSYTLQIFDTQGNKFFEQSIGQGQQQFTVSLTDKQKGNYQVILNTPTTVVREKFIKI